MTRMQLELHSTNKGHSRVAGGRSIMRLITQDGFFPDGEKSRSQTLSGVNRFQYKVCNTETQSTLGLVLGLGPRLDGW